MGTEGNWRRGRNALTTQQLLERLQTTRKGIVVLDGPSGCGKTTLLRQLQCVRKVELRSIEWALEQLVQGMLKQREAQTWAAPENGDCIALEDVDMGLGGRSVTQRMLGQQVMSAARSRLVILTGCELRRRTGELLDEMQEAEVYIWKPERPQQS